MSGNIPTLDEVASASRGLEILARIETALEKRNKIKPHVHASITDPMQLLGAVNGVDFDPSQQYVIAVDELWRPYKAFGRKELTSIPLAKILLEDALKTDKRRISQQTSVQLANAFRNLYRMSMEQQQIPPKITENFTDDQYIAGIAMRLFTQGLPCVGIPIPGKGGELAIEKEFRDLKPSDLGNVMQALGKTLPEYVLSEKQTDPSKLIEWIN